MPVLGSDVNGNEYCAASPVLKNRRMLLGSVLFKSQTRSPWTDFINGIFFDWAFKPRILVNIEPGSVTPMDDDSDHMISSMTLANVGQAGVELHVPK